MVRELRWGRWVVLLAPVGLGALIAQGCTVDVSLALETCESGGTKYDAGESFPSPDGCNTCTCQSDGTAACTALACASTCDYEGVTYQSGETFPSPDGCNTCTCLDDGSVSCTKIACNSCENAPPDCPQPGSPNCSAAPVCDPMAGWQCVVTCDECMGSPPPCVAPPMGCTEDAPVCVDGAWQCGAITCPNGCFYNGEVHPAFEVFPAGDGCNDCVCLEDGSVACTDQACSTCMTEPPPCDPPDPACTATAVCEDGTNWTCETQCDPSFCGGVPPCPAPPPGCTGNPVCTFDGWVCESFCSPMCADPEPICDAPPNCMAYASCGPNGWECVIAC